MTGRQVRSDRTSEVVRAFGYYFAPTAFTHTQYDQVMDLLESAGADAPPGRSYHCAFAAGENVHIFDVPRSVPGARR
jgi:hypothetical protein